MGNIFTLETAFTKIVFASDLDHPDVGPSIENTGDDVMTLTGPFSFVGAIETDDDLDVGGDLDVAGSTSVVALDVTGALTAFTGAFSGAVTGLSLDLTGDLAAATGSFTGDIITETDITALNGYITSIETQAILVEKDQYGDSGDIYLEGTITSEEGIVTVDGIFQGEITANSISIEKDMYATGGTLSVEGLSSLLGGVTFDAGEETLLTGTDTEFIFSIDSAQVGAIGIYTLLPGVLDIPVDMIDCRGLGALELGADWLFGYAGDLVTGIEGVSVVKWSTAYIGLMLGDDSYIYFGDGASNVLADDTWRIGSSGVKMGFEQYDTGTGNWTGFVYATADGLEVKSDVGVIFGDAGTNDSWQIIRSGNDLVIQRRESNTWITKQTIGA